MAKIRARSLALTAVGAFAIVAALLGLLFLVNAESGFAGCTGTMRFGWMAPLLAASIIGGLAWILLSQEPRSEDHGASSAVSCPSCGRDVLGKWRLCPYCGMMLHPDPPSDTKASGSH
ncbi:MAG: zinc ribbon domain-containing protein [Coriobacteriia bacterium]|nr:zinc ribbon domain-containing protein [Coriobacteriia bacterium]